MGVRGGQLYMKFKINLPLFSPDNGANGGGYGLSDEQFANLSFTDDSTEHETFDEYEDELEDQNSELETSEGNEGENNPNLYEIDGEQVDLDTLRQWKSGHMMQSDYTRKTQELSQQRQTLETQIRQQVESQYKPYQDLANYLHQNPHIQQQLQQYMRENPSQQPQQNQNQPIDISAHPEFQTLKQQFEQQQHFIQSWQQEQEQRAIQTEWQDLVSRYPEAKDPNVAQQIASFADENGTNLEVAYRNLMFDRVRQNTEQKMVENNMKKKVGNTVKPQNNSQSPSKPQIPDGNLNDIAKYLIQHTKFNLTE